jgi:hypothetical protein
MVSKKRPICARGFPFSISTIHGLPTPALSYAAEPFTASDISSWDAYRSDFAEPRSSEHRHIRLAASSLRASMSASATEALI